MLPSPSYRLRRQQGFTLLELLAAMAILLVLVLCITQILNGAIGSTKVSRKKIDTDNEVRRIFDRMSGDFAGMQNRVDVDFLIRKNSGSSDEIYFFSEAPARREGGDTPQSVALVGYRVNSEEQLGRFSQALSWDEAPPAGPMFLTYSTFNNTTKTVATESSLESAYSTVLGDENKFHVLAEGVFRMEVDFLLKPTVTGDKAMFSDSPFRSGGTGTFTNKGAGLSDVQAVIVTLVAIDPGSLVISGDLASLAGKFADSVDGATPAEDWQKVVDDPSSLGIPLKAAAGVRVYQRVFPLSKSLTTAL